MLTSTNANHNNVQHSPYESLAAAEEFSADVPEDLFCEIDNVEGEMMWLPFAVLASCFLFVCFGAAYVKGFAGYAAAQNWPVTRGHVVSAKSTTQTIPVAQGTIELTKAQIIYSYTVGGRLYSSEQLGTDELNNDITEYLDASKSLSRYPVGRVIDVHYDPSDPTDATLEFRMVWDPDVDLAAKVLCGLTLLFGISAWRYMIINPKLKRLYKQAEEYQARSE